MASQLQGIKVSITAFIVSHLLYADDLMITCGANERNARAVKKCLDTFSHGRDKKLIWINLVFYSQKICVKWHEERLSLAFGSRSWDRS